MSLVCEYKLQAVWSIKKETFMNEENIKSKHFKTTLPNNVDCCFVLQSDNDDKYSSIEMKLNTQVTVKEMKLLIPSANYEDDLATSNYHPEDFTVAKNTVFIKRDDILDSTKKFFVNNILTIEVRGILCYQENKIDLGYLYWTSDNDKDFSFIVGKDHIKVHKFILRHFSSMLPHDVRPDDTKVTSFDKYVVGNVVGLCYGRKIKFSYPQKHHQITSLFKCIQFTDVYGMPVIKKEVELNLKDYIEKETVCMLANKSVEYKANTLRALCINFLINCIKEGKPVDGYDTLNGEIVAEVFKNSVCHTHVS